MVTKLDLDKIKSRLDNVRNNSIKAEQERNEKRTIFMKERDQKKAYGKRARRLKSYNEFVKAERKLQLAKKKSDKVKGEYRDARNKFKASRGRRTLKDIKLASKKRKALKKQEIKTLSSSKVTVSNAGKNQVSKARQNKVTKTSSLKALPVDEKLFLRNLKSSRQSMSPAQIKRFNQLTEEKLSKKNVNLPDVKKTKLSSFNKWLEQERRKAIKGNKNSKASIIGIASLPSNLLESGASLIVGLAESALNPESTLRAISSIEKKDIQDGGARFGQKLQIGDPSALTDTAVQLTPFKAPRVRNFAEIRKTITSNSKDLKKLESKIKKIEDKGVNTRQRNLDAKELRTLKETKKVLESDLKDLNNVVKAKNKPVVTKKEVREQNKEVKKAINNFKKRDKKRKKQEKTLEQFEKERLAQNKKTKKKSSKKNNLRKQIRIASDNILAKAIKENFTKPTKLKQLKKLIKEEKGLNVKILQTPKGLKVIFKEAGKNLKKGVKTGKKERTYLITSTKKLVRLDKQRKKSSAVVNSLTSKQKKKLQKDLEFKDGQNMEKVLNDIRKHKNKRSSLLSNKKAQAQLFRSSGRTYKKVEKTTKTVINKSRKLIDSYRIRVSKLNQQNKVLKQKGKKSKDFSKADKERFTKQKKKLKKELRESIKEVNSLRKSLSKASKLIPSLTRANKSLQNNLKKQEGLLKKAQDLIQKQDLKLETFKPKSSGKGQGPGKGKKSSGNAPKSFKKKSSKASKGVKSKSKKTKKKTKTKKSNVTPKTKKVKFKKVTTKGEIIYVNSKNQKVKIKTGLPYDWAYKVALETVDQALLRSTKVRKYGRIKSRKGLAFDKSLLNKFRNKKSKNPRVQDIVEKSKHALDTKSEINSIQTKKILASKIKIAKETIKELKKAKRKSSKKTRKKKGGKK